MIELHKYPKPHIAPTIWIDVEYIVAMEDRMGFTRITVAYLGEIDVSDSVADIVRVKQFADDGVWEPK